MPKTAIKIGPADHGRQMSLQEFDRADGQEGYCYELGRGVIIVVGVPGRRHLAQVHAIRKQFYDYCSTHPDQIHTIAAGGECKMLLAGHESERHPDLAVYKSAPPPEDDLWATWVPDIAIEVVSPGSEQRDYVEKRQEYWDFGMREYWIVDAAKQQILVLQRAGADWAQRALSAADTHRTDLLPGMTFSAAPVLAVYKERDA